jgi:mono/diheme cytochrome c family protein
MAVPVAGQGAGTQSPGKKSHSKNSAPVSGAELYKQNCAVCHGNDAKGGGPPPPSSPFTESPPDLTTLARRHGGKFPDAYVVSVLQSGVKMPDHGPSEMPVWGTLFKSMTKSDKAKVAARIEKLTDYLKSIQVK